MKTRHVFKSIFDHEFLSKYNLSNDEKSVVYKYIRTSLKLDQSINNLDEKTKSIALFQNSINYIIEKKLFADLKTNKNMEYFKYETNRIKEEIDYINNSDNYQSNMIRSHAKLILKNYMFESEINNLKVLDYYPETIEELNAINNGSIIKNKTNKKKR